MLPWPKLVAVIVALVVLTLILPVVLDAPRVMVACVVIMLATLAVVGPITLAWKISFHPAVAAGSVVMLAWVLPMPVLVLAAGAVVVAGIGWARAEIRDHPPAQALAGAANVGDTRDPVVIALFKPPGSGPVPELIGPSPDSPG